MKQRSISRRLITAVLLLELLSALLLVGLTVYHESNVRFRSFNVMLRGRADTLLGAVSDAEDEADNVVFNPVGITIPREDLYSVHDDDEIPPILGQSPQWPAEEVKIGEADRDGTFGATVRGRRYRFVRLHGLRVVDPQKKGGGVLHHVTVLYGAPTGQVWHEVREAARFYAVASVLLLTATGWMMAWYLRRGLAPLYELADEAGRISAQQWWFTPPESAHATRELAPLAHAIEAALLRLQQSFKQQERFTSDAAHELKTDVAIVKSSLQLLTMRPRSEEEYRLGLEVCLQDCVRLEGTVQEMLTLAGVQYGAHASAESGEEKSDLALYVRESVQRFSSLAKVREVEVKLESLDRIKVRLDGKECGLLCANLLHNAILHSKPASEVQVTLLRGDESAILMIEDFGEGIAPDVLPHVFEPFFRGDSSRDRRSGGTGLGLAICKAICDKANGSIEIVSTLGEGTRVIVRLPLAHIRPNSLQMPNSLQI